MAAVSTGVLTPDKLYPGGTFLDPVNFDQDVLMRDSGHEVRLAVDAQGQLTIAKNNGAGFTDLMAADLTSGQARFGFGTAPTGNFAATFGRAIKVLGGASFAGDLLPTTQYPVSPYSIGTPDALWYSINAAELRVQSLVADEATVTMGGRQIIGQGNVLAVATTAVQTTVILRRKTAAAGDILHFSGEATGYLVATEFMLVGANPNGDFVGTTGTTRKAHRTVFVNAAGAVRYPAQSATTPFGFAGILEGETVAYEFVVTRNYEVGQVPTATANAWPVDVTVLNTGQPGQGIIDMYVANRLLGLTQTPDTGSYPAALAGPTIEFLQRTGTGAFDIESRTAVGRLDGTYDYAPQTASNASVYGIAAGRQTGNWFAMDPVQGFRMMNAALLVAGFDDNVFTFGVNTTHAVRFDALLGEFRMGAGFVYDDNTGALTITGPAGGVGTSIDGSAVRTGYIRSQATWGAGLYVSELNLNTGAASFARGNLTWDTNGVLTVNRITAVAGTIAGFTIETNRIYSTADASFEIQTGTSARVVAGLAKFGLNVFGGNDGLLFNNDNYWFDDGSILIGGTNGIKYVPGQGVTIGSLATFKGDVAVGSGLFQFLVNADAAATGATIALSVGQTTATGGEAAILASGKFRVTYGGSVSMTDAEVLGNVDVKNLGAIRLLNDGGNIAAGIIPHRTNGTYRGASVHVVSNWSNNAVSRYGLVLWDRSFTTAYGNNGTGPGQEPGQQWILFHEPPPTESQPPTSTTDVDYMTVTTDQAKTGGGVALSAQTAEGTAATVPTTKWNGRLTFNRMGSNNAFYTKDGDHAINGRFQVSAAAAGGHAFAETGWNGTALAGQLRGTYENGKFRPQWFDGAIWRWLDLGNVPSENVAVMWSNVGGRPQIQITSTTGVSGQLDLAANTLTVELAGDIVTETEAAARYLRFDSAVQNLTGTQKQNARTNLGLGALAALTGVAAGQMLYTTGIDTYATTAVSAFGRTLLALADAAAGRLALDVPGKAAAEVIGGAWDFSSGIDFLAGITVATTLTVGQTMTVAGIATFNEFVSNKAPAAPATLTAALAGDTATLTIGRSPTYNVAGGVQQYTVSYRYDDEDDSRLRIAGRLAGFATATATYVVTGLQRRRALVFSVVAVKNGVDSVPVVANVAAGSLPVIGDVSDVVTMAAPQHFELRWKLPADERVGSVQLKVAKAATAGPLTGSNDFATVAATSGVTSETIDLGVTESTEYRFQVSTERNLQFRFWVETVARA